MREQSFAKELVEAGRYSSVSAVLQQGIDLLRQRMQDEDLQRAELKALLDQRAACVFVSGARWINPSRGQSQRGAAPMRFRLEFSAETERDFALIFDHLFESCFSFGESVEAALDQREARIHVIRQEAARLAERATIPIIPMRSSLDLELFGRNFGRVWTVSGRR